MEVKNLIVDGPLNDPRASKAVVQSDGPNEELMNPDQVELLQPISLPQPISFSPLSNFTKLSPSKVLHTRKKWKRRVLLMGNLHLVMSTLKKQHQDDSPSTPFSGSIDPTYRKEEVSDANFL